MDDIKVTDISGQEKPVQGEAVTFDKDGNIKLGNKAVYLGMGGRVICQFPNEIGKDILPTLLDYLPDEPVPVSKKGDSISPEESKAAIIAMKRKASTHLMSRDENGILHEERGKVVGGIKYVKYVTTEQTIESALNSKSGTASFQIGINMTAGGIGNDTYLHPNGQEQNFINRVDDTGSSGHMLIVMQKDSMMVGIEQSGPGATSALTGEKHGISGKSQSLSPFGGYKWRGDASQNVSFDNKEFEDLGLVKPSLNSHGEPIDAMHSEIQETTLLKMKRNMDAYEKYAEQQLSKLAELRKTKSFERQDSGLSQSSTTSVLTHDEPDFVIDPKSITPQLREEAANIMAPIAPFRKSVSSSNTIPYNKPQQKHTQL